jgi:hypothetical protein
MAQHQSIQEGGCTTSPRMLSRLRDENILPVLALLSPIGAVGLAWAASKLGGPGVQSVSFILRVGVVASSLALASSATAL